MGPERCRDPTRAIYALDVSRFTTALLVVRPCCGPPGELALALADVSTGVLSCFLLRRAAHAVRWTERIAGVVQW